MKNNKLTYEKSGVNIKAADKFVKFISLKSNNSKNSGKFKNIGGFGSITQIPKTYKNPHIVSATDGVGTKIEIANLINKFDSIGIDLVAMCVNDLIVQGAKPIIFLDYISINKVDLYKLKKIIKGILKGCKIAGCELVGGETAEMPGTYHKNEYDLVGVATGIIEKNNIIDGTSVQAGDVAVGVFSNGLHTNGYSLARKLIFDTLGLSTSDTLPEHSVSVGECLLAPHTNYSSLIGQVLNKGINIKSISHITGGGLVDNVPRVIPEDVSLEVNINSWNKIPIFDFLKNNLDIETKDLYQTFNMGVGLVFIVEQSEKDRLISLIGKDSCGEIGVVVNDSVNAVHLYG